MSHLQSEQEEANTKLILRKLVKLVLPCMRAPFELINYSPDDRYRCTCCLFVKPHFCNDAAFVTGVGQRRRVIPLKSILTAVGEECAAVFIPFHYSMLFLEQTTLVGFMAKESKPVGNSLTIAPEKQRCLCHPLGTTLIVSESTFVRFVFKLYLQDTQFTEVNHVRWWLKKKQAQSKNLP